ncbi:hypothetical protein [Alteraurantiacibacter buctensis]|uniref:Uncharacterized protein n=1 Tax=Alteraurantiacibacter buctensis TaxID=1503981 RepID=A0A844YZN1_9SPHN|nr:hypothetical protein [Alteraurantiacibacter buctensis]MXO72652.1 hypothetical protein [Alteraurantiacibacter buctensis]
MNRCGLVLLFSFLLAGCNETQELTVPVEPRASESSATISTASAPQGPFAPRDDCAADPAAAAFTAELKQVVAARDADRLLALTDPQVMLDFGGGAGQAELRQRLGSSEYNLWDGLDRIMPLGCAIDRWGNLVLPWHFAQETRLDPFESFIVIGTDVPVRSRPASDAPIVARVSWDEVEMAYGDDPTPSDASGNHWTEIWLQEVEGRDRVGGFIRTDQLRSPIDYRLLADKKSGAYLISVFVAGD